MQDKPTWSISTTRGFPKLEKIAIDSAHTEDQRDLIFVKKKPELQNPPEGRVPGGFFSEILLKYVATVEPGDLLVQFV